MKLREMDVEDMKETLKKMSAAMIEDGIHTVRVEYNGYGDSGCIDGLFYLDENGKDLKILESKYVGINDYEGSLEDLLHEICYDSLPCGWEINEGSVGHMEINPYTNKIKIEHGNRITDVIWEEIEV